MWQCNFPLSTQVSKQAILNEAVQPTHQQQVMQSLPDLVVKLIDPDVFKVVEMRKVRPCFCTFSDVESSADIFPPRLKFFQTLITNLRHSIQNSEKRKHSAFHAILESDLPASEKLDERLGHEAQTIILAGQTTTAWALTCAVCYILSDPQVLAQLRFELQAAIPDAENVDRADAFRYEKLESLPYLTGCIKESIRLSYGVSGRLA